MKVIEKVQPELWEDVAWNCAHATYFHTHYWADFIENTFPLEDVTKAFVFDNGVRAVFPLMLQRHPKWKSRFLDEYISGPLYVYGGPIADGELREAQIEEMMQYIVSVSKKSRSILLRGNPFAKNLHMSGFAEVPDFSQVVELYRHKNEIDLLRSYSRGIRSRINKAKHVKWNLRKEKTWDKLEDFYKLYQESKKYWNDDILTDYPLNMFQNISNMNSQNVFFWTIYYEKEIVGGNIILQWNDFCQLFLTFFNRAFSNLHANRFLLHKNFLDCMEKDIKYFDLRQSGGHKGVEFFKHTLGSKKYAHSSLVKENKLLRQYSILRKKLSPKKS